MLVYDLEMAHKLDRDRCTMTLGARGRLVLPADVRRRLSLDEGSRLLLVVHEDRSLTLLPFATIARNARGLFKDFAPGRCLSEELIAGRRAEAARESRR